MSVLPISAVVATIDRSQVLSRTLDSLQAQAVLPAELIIVDASVDNHTRQAAAAFASQVNSSGCSVTWEQAKARGAAVQRNQGVVGMTQPIAWFFDDDIIFEPQCLLRLWDALQSDAGLGGVSAMIINQHYQRPGTASRLLFRFMAGRAQDTYAGQVIGPAVNLLPEDRDDLPEVVPVQWLNTTCTLYRREALPRPPFPSYFTGYSLMEDVTLSLTVGKRWKLANVRTARIYHDSQPGIHKSDPVAVSRMELVNRSYVMTEILGRRSFVDFARLVLWEASQLALCAFQHRLRLPFWRILRGKCLGAGEILRSRSAGRRT